MATPTEAQVVEARSKQSKNSKAATLDMLRGKNRAKSTFSVYLPDAEGETTEAELTYRAIGANAYDKLVSKHPPTTEQRSEGANFNLDTFAPALIAAVCVDPEMTYDDAKEIWDSTEWSRGEVVTLWRRALDLCNRGIDIPFNADE